MRTFKYFALLLACAVSLSGEPKEGSRILLIPLDDRPVCLQLPTLLGPIANADVITPPRALLGRFTVAGDSAGLASWIKKQDQIDAIIVSLDMLAYGGLVASRVHAATEEEGLARLRVLEGIRQRHPELPIYGFNIIMRLAPTADGTNEAWRVALARWAERISETGTDPSVAAEVRELEERIPQKVLADYMEARARNLAVNRAAIAMVKRGILDYLILGQDDAKPKGIHVADRTELMKLVEENGLEKKVTVQPGADEVAMLLLSRFLTRKADIHPTIRPVFSSERIRTAFAPYEDRPLHQTVSRHIAAAGGRETAEPEADLIFYVFGSRHEEGAAERFAEKIARDVRAGRRVIVADVDTRGDVQGSAIEFTEALRRHDVFPRLFGYASWNTAGNTIGTALPQGILFALATDHLTDRDQRRAREAQADFLLHRLINDYLYHSVVRPDINRHYFREQGLNPMQLSVAEVRELEKEIFDRIRPLAKDIWHDFSSESHLLPDLSLVLPWGRTFEAEIDFTAPRSLP